MNTDHSKQLRKETAAARRTRILDEGGRDLRVLLQKPEAAMLEQLQQWHGTPNQPETATRVIAAIIRVAAGRIQKIKTPDPSDHPYSEGYVACSNNKPVTANPYETETEAWHWWKHGWKHYDADYNPDYYSTPIADDL